MPPHKAPNEKQSRRRQKNIGLLLASHLMTPPSPLSFVSGPISSLGGGQNIYHFAYYGLYNPLLLPSYLRFFSKYRSTPIIPAKRKGI